MFSNKPYLIRAFYEWIIDNKCTPYLVVNANFPRAKVPLEFVENGEITLNISPDAIRELALGNEFIEFRASFSGVIHIVSAPVRAVLAIYAQENQQGMFFDFEDETDGSDDWSNAPEATGETLTSIKDKKRPSHLRLVD